MDEYKPKERKKEKKEKIIKKNKKEKYESSSSEETNKNMCKTICKNEDCLYENCNSEDCLHVRRSNSWTSIENHYHHHPTGTSNSHDAKRHRSVSLAAGGFMGGINRSEFPQKSERSEVLKAYLEIPATVRDTINNSIRRIRFKGYQSKLALQQKFG